MRCVFGLAAPIFFKDRFEDIANEDGRFEVEEVDHDVVIIFSPRLSSPVFENCQIEPTHMVQLENLNHKRVKFLVDAYEKIILELDGDDELKRKITCGWSFI